MLDNRALDYPVAIRVANRPLVLCSLAFLKNNVEFNNNILLLVKLIVVCASDERNNLPIEYRRNLLASHSFGP